MVSVAPRAVQNTVQQTHHQDNGCGADNYTAHQSSRGRFACAFILFRSQQARDIRARPASKNQPEADNDLPDRIRNGYRAHLAGSKPSDKISVHHVVERAHQHADHGWNPHFQKHRGDSSVLQ